MAYISSAFQAETALSDLHHRYVKPANHRAQTSRIGVACELMMYGGEEASSATAHSPQSTAHNSMLVFWYDAHQGAIIISTGLLASGPRRVRWAGCILSRVAPARAANILEHKHGAFFIKSRKCCRYQQVPLHRTLFRLQIGVGSCAQ